MHLVASRPDSTGRVQGKVTLSPGLAAPRPRWQEPKPVEDSVVESLRRELKLPRVACEILARRGYGEIERAKAFLRPSRNQIHAATLFAGMPEAVQRVAAAIARSETILVHGDYDVDGICATALLTRALGMMGGRVVPFVPHRLRDGYDLGAGGLERAQRVGASLIITADCGIVAHAAVARAREMGIDVIVTDHHTPSPTLPPGVAVVNPNRNDCPYPEKSLVGAAVAFKLAVAVGEAVDYPPERLYALLDLVAVATVADLAPVTAENRALLRWGISVLARTPNPGLRALLRTSGLAGRADVSAGQIGFILAPRLNAAGRLGDAMRGVRLLLTADRGEAERLARELEAENRRRRELDEITLLDALRQLERDYEPGRDYGVVLASRDWHPGIIGIVASRVVERIHRPVVMIAIGDSEAKGSARSIRGLHLYEAFTDCAPVLIRYGGHRAAAGCSLDAANVDAFREAFNDAVRSRLDPADLTPEVVLDAVLPLADATPELHRLMRHFAPYGIGNPTPVFAAEKVRLAAPPRIVGGGHLRLALRDDDGRTLPAIGFNLGERISEIDSAEAVVDVAFRLEENVWRDGFGRQRAPELQARLVDVRLAR